MFFHVLENTQRNGVKGYRHIKTYKNYTSLKKWLDREGKPVWVVESNTEYLPVPYKSDGNTPTMYGGFIASYWNTGGWGTTTMPVLSLLR